MAALWASPLIWHTWILILNQWKVRHHIYVKLVRLLFSKNTAQFHELQFTNTLTMQTLVLYSVKYLPHPLRCVCVSSGGEGGGGGFRGSGVRQAGQRGAPESWKARGMLSDLLPRTDASRPVWTQQGLGMLWRNKSRHTVLQWWGMWYPQWYNGGYTWHTHSVSTLTLWCVLLGQELHKYLVSKSSYTLHQITMADIEQYPT